MERFRVETRRAREWIDITEEVRKRCPTGGASGLILVYCPHTTAGITINEGWDPDVAADVTGALEALVPDLHYEHAEGNSPSHLMALLTGPSVTVPFQGGELQLGRWQKIFLCEYDGPRSREVWVQVVGA